MAEKRNSASSDEEWLRLQPQVDALRIEVLALAKQVTDLAVAPSAEIRAACEAFVTALRSNAALYRRMRVQLSRWQLVSRGPLTDILDALVARRAPGGEEISKE